MPLVSLNKPKSAASEITDPRCKDGDVHNFNGGPSRPCFLCKKTLPSLRNHFTRNTQVWKDVCETLSPHSRSRQDLEKAHRQMADMFRPKPAGRPEVYPWSTLAVGDFFETSTMLPSMRSYAYLKGMQYGMRYKCDWLMKDDQVIKGTRVTRIA